MGCCSKEVMRILLWMSWVSQWLFSSIYVTLTLISFARLWEASILYIPATSNNGSSIYTDSTWRAPMSTCILSAALVIGMDLLSCITLIKKSINRAGPGFSYGFLVAMTFVLAFFLLLSGLILDSFRPKVQSLSSFDWTFNGTSTDGFTWSSYDSQTFIGAEVFALLNFVTLLIFAVILVVLQSGVSDQLGINQDNASKRFSNYEVPAALQGGMMEAGSYAYNDQALHPDEQQTLRSGEGGLMTQDYQQQQAPGHYEDPYKQPGAYQAPTAAAPPQPYYGPYGGQQVFDVVDVQSNSAPPPPGSGLLGGIGIGSSVQSSQGPPPPYYNHQNF